MTSRPSNWTGIVLTKDEESNIGRCISSLGWCERTVVVDSGSSDRTAEVARGLGADVLVHVQEGPFNIAEQRNWALDSVDLQTGWVLFLDADEAVPEALASELTRLSADSRDGLDALELTPRYLFWGRWLRRTQGYPNWHARAVRLGNARFVGGVWEHFATGARIGRVLTPYDHFANSKGLSDWLARHDRYSSWDAERVVEFLDSGRGEALKTERKKKLRRLAARWWPLRPWVRFAQMYFLRLGFLEGVPAFVLCLLYFFYEWMTVLKIVELRRQRKGLPL